MQQILKVHLREWLTHHLLNIWLVPGWAYRLGLVGQTGANPDQRIEEDARKLADLSAGLAVGMFQAALLLIGFVGILWTLSNHRQPDVFMGCREISSGLQRLGFAMPGSISASG